MRIIIVFIVFGEYGVSGIGFGYIVADLNYFPPSQLPLCTCVDAAKVSAKKSKKEQTERPSLLDLTQDTR